jgi:hypothetical protein
MNPTHDDLVYVGGYLNRLTPRIVKSPLPPFAKGGIGGIFKCPNIYLEDFFLQRLGKLECFLAKLYFCEAALQSNDLVFNLFPFKDGAD